jgi:hypothetical protein
MEMNIPAEYFRKGSRNKYGAKKTVVGDIKFDSKKKRIAGWSCNCWNVPG